MASEFDDEEELSIALDLDSVLADTGRVALDLLDADIEVEDLDSWHSGPEEFGRQSFLDALWHAWTLRPDEIEPMEDNLSIAVNDLRIFGNVDIVTHTPDRPGIAKQKRDWLDRHEIRYDEFMPLSLEVSKSFIGYDVYIDDKPSLVEMVNREWPDALFLLRERPYNKDVKGAYSLIESVHEAPDEIRKEKVETDE